MTLLVGPDQSRCPTFAQHSKHISAVYFEQAYFSHGKRRRERPRTKWTDVILRDVLNLGFGWSIKSQRWQLKTAIFGGKYA